MDTTIGLNLSGKEEYKSIPNAQINLIIEAVKQINKQHSFELKVEIMQDVERLVKAMTQPLDHLDEAEAALASEPPKVKESFHSIKEIKAVIAANIEPIYEYFKGRVFSLGAFTDHLKSYVTLRDHDYNPDLSYNRWDTQVNSSIRGVKLPDHVIEHTGKRGYYTIKLR